MGAFQGSNVAYGPPTSNFFGAGSGGYGQYQPSFSQQNQQQSPQQPAPPPPPSQSPSQGFQQGFQQGSSSQTFNYPQPYYQPTMQMGYGYGSMNPIMNGLGMSAYMQGYPMSYMGGLGGMMNPFMGRMGYGGGYGGYGGYGMPQQNYQQPQMPSAVYPQPQPAQQPQQQPQTYQDYMNNFNAAHSGSDPSSVATADAPLTQDQWNATRQFPMQQQPAPSSSGPMLGALNGPQQPQQKQTYQDYVNDMSMDPEFGMNGEKLMTQDQWNAQQNAPPQPSVPGASMLGGLGSLITASNGPSPDALPYAPPSQPASQPQYPANGMTQQQAIKAAQQMNGPGPVGFASAYQLPDGSWGVAQ